MCAVTVARKLGLMLNGWSDGHRHRIGQVSWLKHRKWVSCKTSAIYSVSHTIVNRPGHHPCIRQAPPSSFQIIK